MRGETGNDGKWHGARREMTGNGTKNEEANTESQVTVEEEVLQSDEREANTESQVTVEAEVLHLPDAVVVKCSNGPYAMHMPEFERLLRAGNVLRKLVVGAEGMRQERELKLDVFASFSVDRQTLGLILACVRTGKLPQDQIAHALVVSGKLRDAADRLGGFEAVDAALARAAQAEDARKEAEGGRQEDLRTRFVKRPLDDASGTYEWKTIVAGLAGDGLQPASAALTEAGFGWTDYEVIGAAAMHFFRRPRKLARLLYEEES